MELKEVLEQWIDDHERQFKHTKCEEIRTIKKFLEVYDDN